MEHRTTSASKLNINAMQKQNGNNPEPQHPRLTHRSPNVWEYQPQAVVAPAGKPPRIYSGEPLRQLMAAEPDAHTLFYDLFRTLDGKAVIALQAGEFAESFGNLTFSHRGKTLRTKRQELTNKGKTELIIWRIQLPRRARHADAQIKFRTGTGAEIEINIPPNPFAKWTPTDLFQQTMIKDYPFTLVRDHCLFHHRVHGFKRMVLYDNGSAGYKQQLEALETLDPGLQIVVINWPFPWFRESIRKFMGTQHEVLSQLASFNHGLRILGGLSRFGLNLDMDEYLYNNSGTPLAQLLARHTRVLPFRKMASYRIPGITDMNHGKHARATDFQYLPSTPCDWNQLFWAAKCFYRIGKSPLGMMQVEHISTHAASLNHNLAAKIRAWGRKRSGVKFVFIFRSQKIAPAFIRIYHYKGMGPNWHAEKDIKFDPGRWELQPPDPHKHVRFKEIAQLMASIGLDRPQGEHP